MKVDRVIHLKGFKYRPLRLIYGFWSFPMPFHRDIQGRSKIPLSVSYGPFSIHGLFGG